MPGRTLPIVVFKHLAVGAADDHIGVEILRGHVDDHALAGLGVEHVSVEKLAVGQLKVTLPQAGVMLPAVLELPRRRREHRCAPVAGHVGAPNHADLEPERRGAVGDELDHRIVVGGSVGEQLLADPVEQTQIEVLAIPVAERPRRVLNVATQVDAEAEPRALVASALDVLDHGQVVAFGEPIREDRELVDDDLLEVRKRAGLLRSWRRSGG